MIHENVDKAKKSSGCPSQGGGGDMAQKQQEQQVEKYLSCPVYEPPEAQPPADQNRLLFSHEKFHCLKSYCM